MAAIITATLTLAVAFSLTGKVSIGTTRVARSSLITTRSAGIKGRSISVRRRRPMRVSRLRAARGGSLSGSSRDVAMSRDVTRSVLTARTSATIMINAIDSCLATGNSTGLCGVGLPTKMCLRTRLAAPTGTSLSCSLCLLSTRNGVLANSSCCACVGNATNALPRTLNCVASNSATACCLCMLTSRNKDMDRSFALSCSMDATYSSCRVSRSMERTLTFACKTKKTCVRSEGLDSPVSGS